MFDDFMRRGKDTIFTPIARPLLQVQPWVFSLIGLLIGLATAVVLAYQLYIWGVVLFFFNRVFDALDGLVARMSGNQSDFGGYLDILLDFVVYAVIPIGLVVGQPSSSLYLALIFLLAIYYVNGASWMYLAAILEKRSGQPLDRITAVSMPAGIIGGTETIIFYTVFMFFPGQLIWWFGLMGGLLIVTIIQRLLWAAKHL